MLIILYDGGVKEKTRAGGKWTEARYWQFIRTGIRKVSMRWPPSYEVMKENRRPYVGPNKRQKWEHQCAQCGEWFPSKQIQRHHVIPCGSCKCVEDIGPFVVRMLCEKDGYRKLCKECHKAEKNKGEA